MTILQAIVLGVVQGITEFLPISSSGHLIIFPELFGWERQGLDFDALTHLATLTAIIWVFWKDLLGIAKGLFDTKSKEGQLGWKIVVGTIPVVLFGLMFTDAIEEVRTVQTAGTMLVVWGVILWLADVYSQKQKKLTDAPQKMSWKQAIVVGVIQMAALIPGTSRSGSTISGGLFVGLNRETAARFSFLLAIPAIAGAGLFVMLDAVQSGFETGAGPLIAGFIASLVSGIFAIRLLLNLVKRMSYGWFAAYRIVIGLILLIWFV